MYIHKDCSLIKDTKQKYAFIKKSTIFPQSLQNFVKMRSKFCNDWVKIVDFLIKVYLLKSQQC